MTAKLIVKRALGMAARLGRRNHPRRVILLYHSVGEGPWAIPEQRFAEQVGWLSRHARFRDTGALVRETQDGGLQIAITFDDGYACLRDIALPLLDAVGATATVYLNTGWIEPRDRKPSAGTLGHYPGERFLSWDDVTALAQGGWAVGSHGVDHIDLTVRTDAEARDQLMRSKEAIELKLDRPCVEFAYTWGRSTPRLRRLVFEAGYGLAMGGAHRPVRRADDLMAIPRINVSNDYSLDDFKAVVCGDWDYLGVVQQAKAAWR